MGEIVTYTSVCVLALLTCALTVSASPPDPKILQVTQKHQLLGTKTEHQFKAFIQEYGKEYSTREEYLHRLGIFARNLIRAVEHQALDPTAVHGVTPFSDLTEEEFESTFMGLRGHGVAGAASMMEVRGLPESFDWREKGVVTDVKMQVSNYDCHRLITTPNFTIVSKKNLPILNKF